MHFFFLSFLFAYLDRVSIATETNVNESQSQIHPNAMNRLEARGPQNLACNEYDSFDS